MGLFKRQEGNAAALQSARVLAFPVLLRFVWESHLWCVRESGTIASSFETGVDS